MSEAGQAPAPAAHDPLALLGLLILGAFAAGCGMRLLDPLLPMVAEDLGVQVAALSAVIGAFALAYGAGQFVTGPLGDRLGKLRVLAAALVLYGLVTMAVALVMGLPMLIAARAAAGLTGGAVFPLAMAWIGDTVPYAERQAVIGRLLTGMVAAQLLAGPCSGLLGEFFGWRAAFLVLGCVGIIAGGLLIWRLGPAMRQGPAKGQGSSLGLAAWRRLLARPAGRQLMFAAAIDGFCLFGGAFPYVGSYLIQEFGLGAGHAGLVVAVFGFGSLLYTRIAKHLVRRLGEARLLLFGGLGLAGGLAGLGLVQAWWQVGLLQVFFGLAFFSFHGVLQARATEALPEARATSVAAFAMALFLGQSLGSIAFGQIMGAAGYSTAFFFGASVMAGLAVWCRVILARRG